MDDDSIDKCIKNFECVIMNSSVDTIVHLFQLLKKRVPEPYVDELGRKYLGQINRHSYCGSNDCDEKKNYHHNFGHGDYCDNQVIIEKYLSRK